MKNTKRLTIEIPAEDHADFKKRAIDAGLTLTEWVYASLQIMRANEDKKHGQKDT